VEVNRMVERIIITFRRMRFVVLREIWRVRWRS